MAQSLGPVGVSDHGRDDVCNIQERKQDKDLLQPLVVAENNQQPHQYGCDWNRDVLAHSEQVHAAGYACKFRDHVTDIAEHERPHEEESDAQAILLSNQLTQPFARGHSHARGDLLRKGEAYRYGNDGPEKSVSELSAGSRVSVDTTGVVINVGGDEPRSKDGQDEDE